MYLYCLLLSAVHYSNFLTMQVVNKIEWGHQSNQFYKEDGM